MARLSLFTAAPVRAPSAGRAHGTAGRRARPRRMRAPTARPARCQAQDVKARATRLGVPSWQHSASAVWEGGAADGPPAKGGRPTTFPTFPPPHMWGRQPPAQAREPRCGRRSLCCGGARAALGPPVTNVRAQLVGLARHVAGRPACCDRRLPAHASPACDGRPEGRRPRAACGVAAFPRWNAMRSAMRTTKCAAGRATASAQLSRWSGASWLGCTSTHTRRLLPFLPTCSRPSRPPAVAGHRRCVTWRPLEAHA